jgi:CRISPR-associated protein Cas1
MKIPLKDAKKTGLNKSTLWYIQKNIKEGKTVELYDKVKLKLSNNLNIIL